MPNPTRRRILSFERSSTRSHGPQPSSGDRGAILRGSQEDTAPPRQLAPHPADVEKRSHALRRPRRRYRRGDCYGPQLETGSCRRRRRSTKPPPAGRGAWVALVPVVPPPRSSREGRRAPANTDRSARRAHDVFPAWSAIPSLSPDATSGVHVTAKHDNEDVYVQDGRVAASGTTDPSATSNAWFPEEGGSLPARMRRPMSPAVTLTLFLLWRT